MYQFLLTFSQSTFPKDLYSPISSHHTPNCCQFIHSWFTRHLLISPTKTTPHSTLSSAAPESTYPLLLVSTVSTPLLLSHTLKSPVMGLIMVSTTYPMTIRNPFNIVICLLCKRFALMTGIVVWACVIGVLAFLSWSARFTLPFVHLVLTGSHCYYSCCCCLFHGYFCYSLMKIRVLFVLFALHSYSSQSPRSSQPLDSFPDSVNACTPCWSSDLIKTKTTDWLS